MLGHQRKCQELSQHLTANGEDDDGGGDDDNDDGGGDDDDGGVTEICTTDQTKKDFHAKSL